MICQSFSNISLDNLRTNKKSLLTSNLHLKYLFCGHYTGDKLVTCRQLVNLPSQRRKRLMKCRVALKHMNLTRTLSQPIIMYVLVSLCYLNPRQPALNRGVSHGVRSAQMTPFLVFFSFRGVAALTLPISPVWADLFRAANTTRLVVNRICLSDYVGLYLGCLPPFFRS